MRTSKVVAGLVAVVLVLAGCGGPPGDAGRIDAKLVADLKPGDAAAVGQAVDAFGFELFKQVGDGKQNTVTSPLSMAVLLAMLLAGAEGDTAAELGKALHLNDSRDVRVGALLRQVADTEDVKLSVADSVWADEGFPVEKDYRDFLHRTFGATAEEGDLGAPETAAKIDDWVDENTNGLIEDVAKDLGLPSGNAVLVLLNAVYFLGEWTTPFDPAGTRPSEFAGIGQVPTMMMLGERFEHVQRDGYRMLRLPYGEDGRYGMEIMLPDRDSSLPALVGKLDVAEWHAATAGLAEHDFKTLTLPRFELRWDGNMNEPLQRLGIKSAFQGGDDFRPMSPAGPGLDRVIHKTYIRVDEKGTEAAAVSGGVMTASGPAESEIFQVDRPFAFTVSDRTTGTILFLGAVTDPRG
ncbi:serpin family protein [Actinoplanes sp. NBRC 103695]|uniref:serpin family protein n=1 Tax=Actinoplanes sp. NBRC 103695 TaxID=3032202 RepID=UPI0025563EC8|nr:serpin family protein [Actinoplanes sp. NBRC 103695]